jgi:L-lactate utilization protein LutB
MKLTRKEFSSIRKKIEEDLPIILKDRLENSNQDGISVYWVMAHFDVSLHIAQEIMNKLVVEGKINYTKQANLRTYFLVI